jgi:dephospho-CoA kinase
MHSFMKKRLKNKNKLIIGLTGGFGTGKTTVAGLLRSKGIKVIDADAIGHRLLKPGTQVYAAIVRRFGSDVLQRDGNIDRGALSRVVFSKDSCLAALNRIIHPEIIRIIKNEISLVRKGVVVLDAPLLLEVGFQRFVDKVVVVTASRLNQVKRAQAGMRLSKAAVIRRIRSQIPLQDKVRMADFVIDNNGTKGSLRKRVEEIRRMWWIS